LAESIRERGIVQPLIVRRHGDSYQLIAGERRLRAATRVGLDVVPVVVRDASDSDMLEIALIENVQREDLNAIEEAEAYKRLIGELGLRQEGVATRVGKDRSTIANSLRLLQLPDEVREAVAAGLLSAGHARAVAMAGSVDAILALARRVLSQKLSVRQAEKLAKGERAAKPERDPEVRDVEERLTRVLGTKVRVTPKSQVAGTVAIEYFSLDQFDALLRRLGA
jgi:ParB family chromosome partitioning protein